MRYSGRRGFPQKIVSWIFAAATSGYRVGLDFSDTERVYLGPQSEPNAVDVAVRPPGLWRTLWIFMKPSLRTGESFAQGHWDVTEGDLSTFLRIIQMRRPGLYFQLRHMLSRCRGPLFHIHQRLLTKWVVREGSRHYDVEIEVLDRMLDPSRQYSCAFFSVSGSEDLEAAQKDKLATSIRRLHLDRPGLSVLDIGCGSGTLAAEIALAPGRHNVLGITLSRSQLAQALALREGIDPTHQRRLEFKLMDYQGVGRLQVHFDRIISIGMFEHVGIGRHADFFNSVQRGLDCEGRALIHSIVRPSPGSHNEWIGRYIFPGYFIPSIAELLAAAEKADLIIDAVHVHPPSDYRRTIQAWRRRFETGWLDLERINPSRYSSYHRKLWTFYLAAVETIFTEDLMNFRVVQVELRKPPKSR